MTPEEYGKTTHISLYRQTLSSISLSPISSLEIPSINFHIFFPCKQLFTSPSTRIVYKPQVQYLEFLLTKFLVLHFCMYKLLPYISIFCQFNAYASGNESKRVVERFSLP